MPQSTPARIAHSPLPPEQCGMADAANLLGDRWQLLILRSILYGVSRFEDLQRELKISRGVLSTKLGALLEAGLLERVAYQEEGARPRAEYRPAEAARALFPVFAALQQWGDAWLRAKPSALRPVSRVSGEPLRLAFVTKRGEIVPLRDVTMG